MEGPGGQDQEYPSGVGAGGQPQPAWTNGGATWASTTQPLRTGSMAPTPHKTLSTTTQSPAPAGAAQTQPPNNQPKSAAAPARAPLTAEQQRLSFD